MQAFAGYLWARANNFSLHGIHRVCCNRTQKVKTIKKTCWGKYHGSRVHFSSFVEFFLFDNSSTNWGLYIVQLLFKATQSLFVKLEVQYELLTGSLPAAMIQCGTIVDLLLWVTKSTVILTWLSQSDLVDPFNTVEKAKQLPVTIFVRLHHCKYSLVSNQGDFKALSVLRFLWTAKFVHENKLPLDHFLFEECVYLFLTFSISQ